MRYELKNMLTTGVMAKELGINPKTLKKWAKQRKVPYYRNPANGYWYFNKKDVLGALGIERTVEGMLIDILRGWE
jgi:DNA-binding transcriptional MerR regulator